MYLFERTLSMYAIITHKMLTNRMVVGIPCPCPCPRILAPYQVCAHLGHRKIVVGLKFTIGGTRKPAQTSIVDLQSDGH